MKLVPINELKKRLPYWLSLAAAGELIAITRYNRAYVYLFGADTLGLHRGARVGKSTLKPVLSAPTRGKWRDVLEEDRREK
mgnify:FL=1